MKRCAIAWVAALAALMSGCVTTSDGPKAGAKMDARSDSSVRGVVSFTELEKNTKVFVDLTGVIPGEHGFHIHEVGDCGSHDASSAGGHFNPEGKPHGHPSGTERHAGDLPNLVADDYGTVRTTFFLTGLSLSGDKSIIGRSVVVDAQADDYKAKATAKPSRRIACGIIYPL